MSSFYGLRQPGGSHRYPATKLDVTCRRRRWARTNVIGEAAQTGEGGVVANLFARATTSAAARRGEAFSLGERAAILHHLDQAALIPHVAKSEGKKFPYEVGLQPAAYCKGQTAS
jgi:hypothetical protein